MENLPDHIEINLSVMFGKPVIKGTRITVESILYEPASGYSTEHILQAHPTLTVKDIFTALQ